MTIKITKQILSVREEVPSMNKWFILRGAGTINGDRFSFFTSTGHSFIKYDVLDMKFKIMCTLQWFVYNWRRRDGENISYMYANSEIAINIDEIFAIPLFKSINEEVPLKKAKLVEKMINDDLDVKQAMIERYANDLGGKVYSLSGDNIVNKWNDRFCDFNDIGKKRLFGNADDDFNDISEITKCIIKSYK